MMTLREWWDGQWQGGPWPCSICSEPTPHDWYDTLSRPPVCPDCFVGLGRPKDAARFVICGPRNWRVAQ
jgi:hypothetical protein